MLLSQTMSSPPRADVVLARNINTCPNPTSPPPPSLQQPPRFPTFQPFSRPGISSPPLLTTYTPPQPKGEKTNEQTASLPHSPIARGSEFRPRVCIHAVSPKPLCRADRCRAVRPGSGQCQLYPETEISGPSPSPKACARWKCSGSRPAWWEGVRCRCAGVCVTMGLGLEEG